MSVYKPVLRGVHIDVSLPITRLGQPESFVDVEFLEIKFVNNRLSDQFVIYPSYKLTVTENVVSVIIPDTDNSRLQLGQYDVEFIYRKTNVLRPNQYEPFKLVISAFSLVATTSELDGTIPTDVEVQSVVIDGELFIARDGVNGASAFQIWKAFIGNPESTELDYLSWLRLPADDAAAEISQLQDTFSAFALQAESDEQTRKTKEVERIDAEAIRLIDEQLRKNGELYRESKELERQQNETDRDTLFDQMVSESVAATSAANAAATAQNTYNVTLAVPLSAGTYYTKTTARAAVPSVSRKIGLVITYATAANIWYTERYIGSNVSGWGTESNWEQVPDAAQVASIRADLNEIETDLNLDEYTIAEAFNLLYRKIISLETIIANGIFKNLQVDNLTTVNAFNYNGAPLIIIGNTAPSSAPDFVGQTYVNTTAPGTVYSAKGVSSVSDWKQTSN